MAREEELVNELKERTNSGALKWEGHSDNLVATIQAGTFRIIKTRRDPRLPIYTLLYEQNGSQSAETLSMGESGGTVHSLREVVLRARGAGEDSLTQALLRAARHSTSIDAALDALTEED